MGLSLPVGPTLLCTLGGGSRRSSCSAQQAPSPPLRFKSSIKQQAQPLLNSDRRPVSYQVNDVLIQQGPPQSHQSLPLYNAPDRAESCWLQSATPVISLMRVIRVLT